MTPAALSPPRRKFDAQLRASLAGVALTGAGLAIAALALFGPAVAFSVAVGAALAAGNLWALARIVTALLPAPDEDHPDSAGGGRPREGGTGALGWAVLGIVKMFALFAVVWLLMRNGMVSALPMVAGFSALPIGIAIGSLVRNRGA